MKGRMDAVEDRMTDLKATTKANGNWLNWLWPMIYAAAGVAIYVAALHANDLLKAIKP